MGGATGAGRGRASGEGQGMWRNNKGVSIEGWRRGAGQRTRAARVNTDFVPAAARCYRDADLDRDFEGDAVLGLAA